MKRAALLGVVVLGWTAMFAACSSESHAPAAGDQTNDVRVVRGEGLACTVEATYVCAMDGSGASTGDVLLCKNGVWTKAFACPTGEACATIEGHGGVQCGGLTLVADGATCDTEGAGACTMDLSAVAICTMGTWKASHHCAPAMCTETTASNGATVAQCGADDVYSVGDVCTFGMGHGVCSTDHASILDCENGKTAVMTKCDPGTACARVPVDGGIAVECVSM